ncbi:hypothetical protein [Phenylobacterium sp.]|uniref:hypothetical protein n=1 Tax=Phenylobacterium sp. TaxID=1871053 RepID=UPI003D269718
MSSTSSVASVTSQPPVSFRPPVDADKAQAIKAADDKAKAGEASVKAKAGREPGKGQVLDIQA